MGLGGKGRGRDRGRGIYLQEFQHSLGQGPAAEGRINLRRSEKVLHLRTRQTVDGVSRAAKQTLSRLGSSRMRMKLNT